MLYLLTLQSIISALVFSLRRPRHVSNYLLSLWFAINALSFIGLLIPGGLVSFIKIGYLPFLFLNGPIFMFYVRSQIDIDFRFKWSHALNLLPFFFISVYRLISISESVKTTSFYNPGMPLKYLIIYTLICASVIIYLTVIFILLIRHNRNIKNYFSSKSQRLTLNWVVIIMIIIAVSNIFQYFVPLFYNFLQIGVDLGFWFNQFNLGMLGFLLLVFGLLQPPIYIDQPVNQEERKEQIQHSKYTRSGLNKHQLGQHALTIQKYIETNKPYLNPDYNLELMARDLNITRQNLSQTINDEMGKNFYQLINEFRVAAFKQYLNDPKMSHINFLGLAYEAGFNSKSSFYRLFKEVTGETPTEYRQRLNKEI